MPACLSFDEIVSLGRPQISRLVAVGDSFRTADDPGACEAFSAEVRAVEAFVRHTYALATQLARRTDSLEEISGIWREVSQLCDTALTALRELRQRFAYCGTPELYDLVLDYKLAADDRFNRVKEEIAWQSMELPKDLFPALN